MPLPKQRTRPARFVPLATKRDQALLEAIASVKFNPMANALNKKVGMGKHKDKTWKEVLEKNPFYVKWCASEVEGYAGEVARYLLEYFPLGKDDE